MNFIKNFDILGISAKEIPCITGSGAPTSSTEGAVGCLYMDADTGNMYKCTAVSDGVYTWETLLNDQPSRDCIIDVAALPETDINEHAFYRLLNGSFIRNGVEQGSMYCYVVEELPEEGTPVLDVVFEDYDPDPANHRYVIWTDGMHIYHNLSDGEQYVYLDDDAAGLIGGDPGWRILDDATCHAGSYYIGNYGGLLTTSLDDASPNTTYLVLHEEVYYYHYNNGGFVSISDNTGGGSSDAVLYTPQTRTEEEKAQARENIGAPAEDEVVKEVHTITVKCGEALLTDDIVTLGTGWTGNLTDGFTHTSGNTEPLTFDIGSVDGERYLIGANLSAGGNVSCLRLTIGNSYPTDPYGSNPWVWGVQSVDGGSLKLTPVSNWSGTITNIDCRKITADGENEYSFVVDNIAHEGMSNHLSGFWDIQMGKDALMNSVNTTRCIAIGNSSLEALKTGGRNICLGTFTLPAMTYGEDNVAIGADSGLYVQEAHGCVSIGKSAMSAGEKYTSCIAIGHAALYGSANADAKLNIGIGEYAGYKVTSAKSNTFIGNNAGYNVTTGSMNTFIGNSAGRTAASWGCTVIGAGADTGTYTKSIAIGYAANATKSLQAVLGGDDITETLLKGDLVVRGTDGVKRQIVFNADGTVGWTTVQ